MTNWRKGRKNNLLGNLSVMPAQKVSPKNTKVIMEFEVIKAEEEVKLK